MCQVELEVYLSKTSERNKASGAVRSFSLGTRTDTELRQSRLHGFTEIKENPEGFC
ncbi:hypothetical protein BJV78DRAFT_1228258, partial [Lactifluus subvellereus]